jgi:hypothetical protein
MYNGPWKAVVTDIDDPERRGRIRAKVYELLQDEDHQDPLETDWMLPAYPHTAKQPPPVGSGTWVMSTGPATDIQSLVWLGAYDSMPGGISEYPALGQEDPPGPMPLDRGLRRAELPDFRADFGDRAEPAHTISEAPFDQVIEYPHVLVEEGPDGSIRARNSTPGSRGTLEALGAYQREVRETGAIRQRGTSSTEFLAGDRKEVTEGDEHSLVGGSVVRSVEGNASHAVDGTLFLRAGEAHIKVGAVEIKVGIDPTMAGTVQSLGSLDVKVIGELLIASLKKTLMALEGLTVMSMTGSVEVLSGEDSKVHGAKGAELTCSAGKVRLMRRVPALAGTPGEYPTKATAQPVVKASAAAVQALLGARGTLAGMPVQILLGPPFAGLPLSSLAPHFGVATDAEVA